MRVLHVINSLGPGGAERSLTEMLPGFTESGLTNAVACLSQAREGFHAEVERLGVPVFVVGPSRPVALRRLRRLVRGWRPDIVHTTIFDADVLGRLAGWGAPCRVVTSLVNTTYDGARIADSTIDPRRLAIVKAIDRVTARRLTDHFHAISPAVRDSAVAHLGVRPDQVTVVERGRDLTRLGEPSRARRSAVRLRLGLAPDAPVVLNVGRQEPQKDQATLLRAIAKLRADRPDVVLLQAGRSGKDSALLRSLSEELGIMQHVRFLGHREDVGDLLAAADVFAFPSVYEGLGGSVLEAMAMRVPVVVSEIPALVEVVDGGTTGLVVPVGDPDGFADAIGHLLDDRAAAQALAARAHDRFRSHYTLERSVSRMVDLYQRVAAGEG